MTDTLAAAWGRAKFAGDDMHVTARVRMADLLRHDISETYALGPFAPVLIDDRWWIAARCSVDADLQDEVLLIDGRDGSMRFGDDDTAIGFWGDTSPMATKLRVYSNGIVLARDWAANRARMKAMADTAPLHAHGVLSAMHMPGLAMIGDPARIGNFSDIAHVETIEIDNPRLRHVLADAMLRAARLPVVTAPPRLKAVA